MIGGEEPGGEAGVGVILKSPFSLPHNEDYHLGIAAATLTAEWRADRGSVSLRGSVWFTFLLSAGFSFVVSDDIPRRPFNAFAEYGFGISGLRAYWRSPFRSDPLTPSNEFVLSVFVPSIDL